MGNTGEEKPNDRIFISYKRADLTKVSEIKKRIESELHETCWFDLDGIESTQQFRSKICSAIDRATVFLFMYSKSHLNIDFENDWTIKELDYARLKIKLSFF
ncbi:MAG: toll/interleukin-1 receptor domain-containing protein [Candidatus Limimorpha sp.]